MYLHLPLSTKPLPIALRVSNMSGDKKETIAPGYAIEHVRVNTASQLPPLAEVRQAQASVTDFQYGSEALHLVVCSQSSQLVYAVLLLW